MFHRDFFLAGPLAVIAVLQLCAFAHAESLHGRIMDRASFADSPTGKPVAGARLVLYDNATGKRVAVKGTDRTGVYRFARIAPGAYTLAADRQGYLPSPLLRIVSIGAEDTLGRDFLLDALPVQGGVAAQSPAAKKKKNVAPYYPRLARGILVSGRLGNFFREATENQITLSRFFDPEDTSEAYRELWMELSWAEIESQQRPIASMVYLAHALDSLLTASGLAAPPELKPFLKVPADSMEALMRAVHAMILSPSKKNPPENLAKHPVPKPMLSAIIEEQMDSKAIPKGKKKAFLAKCKGLLGPVATGAMMAKLEPLRVAKADPKKKKEPPAPPRRNTEALWSVVQRLADGKRANPVACYHVALRHFEEGRAREALTDLDRFASMRSDYAPATRISALCRLALKDTAAAAALFDSLSRTDSPEWQAQGLQGLARIQWKQGQGEKAEASLWKALGFDSRSAEARKSLLLLAEVSLTRDSWASVENLLDSLVRARPKEAEGHYWLGKMAMKRQQDGVALDHFRKASTLDPQRVEFSIAAAEAYFSREEYDGALKTLRPLRARLNAEGLSIYGQCLLLKGRPQEAVEEFARLYAAQPSSANLAQLAKALTASGSARKAIATVQASSFTQDSEVRKAWAEAYLNLDSADQAMRLLRPLLAEKESDADAHFLMGRAAFRKRDYPQASHEFTSALQYREDYPEAKYQQGLSLLKLGRSGEAHHYFLELADSDKPSWRAKGLLGQGQAFAKEGKLEAAVENLQRSFQAVASAEAAAHLATTFMRMEKTDEASGWADQAQRLDPGEPLGLMAAVDVLLTRHRDAEAVARAQAGLAKHLESCDFLIVAAKAYLRAGRDAEAKTLSLQAKDRCPEESAPYFFLGSLAGKTGASAEARKDFEDYLRSGGDSKRVPVAYR